MFIFLQHVFPDTRESAAEIPRDRVSFGKLNQPINWRLCCGIPRVMTLIPRLISTTFFSSSTHPLLNPAKRQFTSNDQEITIRMKFIRAPSECLILPGLFHRIREETIFHILTTKIKFIHYFKISEIILFLEYVFIGVYYELILVWK